MPDSEDDTEDDDSLLANDDDDDDDHDNFPGHHPDGTTTVQTPRRTQERAATTTSSPAVPPTPRWSAGGSGTNHENDDDENDATDSLVPPTPAARRRRYRRRGGGAEEDAKEDDNDEDDNDDDTPLTPLSQLGRDEDNDGNDDTSHLDEQADHERTRRRVVNLPTHDLSMDNHNHHHNHNHDDDDNNIGVERATGGDAAHIRGTDVHVPTAAAAFVDFLRHFRSLDDAARHRHRPEPNVQQQRQDNCNDPDDANADRESTREEENDDSDDDLDERPPPYYLTRLQSLLTTGSLFVPGEYHTPAVTATAALNPSLLTASLEIDTMHLYYHSPACQRFYYQLIAYPMELVPLMDILVQRELERLADTIFSPGDPRYQRPPGDALPRVQVRPFNLKQVSNLRALDPVAMDHLLSLKGMIVRSSPVIPDLKVAHFGCAICGHTVQVTIDRGRIAEPTQRCPQCNTAAYQMIHNRCVYADKQLVRLQETPDEVPAGQTPASVVTFCFDDLVDSVQPGDKVRTKEECGVCAVWCAWVNGCFLPVCLRGCLLEQ